MAQIIIPTPLRKFTDNQSTFNSDGNTVMNALKSLTLHYPAIKQYLFDDQGKIRSFINIFVGDENVALHDTESSGIDAGSIVSIVPAIAGGTE